MMQLKPRIQKSSEAPSTNSFKAASGEGMPIMQIAQQPSFDTSVQETPNARSQYVTSEDDGSAEHRINQYVVKQEIGRGSFGAVHIATDQYGQEYVGNTNLLPDST